MKQFTILATLFVSLLVLGSTGANAQLIYSKGRPVAQTLSDPATIETQAKSLPGLVDVSTPRARAEALRTSESNSLSTIRGARDTNVVDSQVPNGPGDHPIFVLQSNREFIHENERLTLTLLPMVDMAKDLSGYIQILYPGNDGQYDGTFPVAYVPLSTPHMTLENISVLSPIQIYSRVFNPEDKFGRYTFNIVTFNAAGDLEQQIIYDVFYGDAGRYGRFFYAEKANPSDQGGVTLKGRFPERLPVYYAMKLGQGSLITGPDPRWAGHSKDGRILELGGGASFDRTTPVSIYMWAPGSRYAFVKSDAYATEVVPH